MSFKQRWERLPQWVQVTVYTVLGLAAMAGVGLLAFRLLSGTDGGNIGIWRILAVLAIVSAVFGGVGRSGRRAAKRRSRDTDDE